MGDPTTTAESTAELEQVEKYEFTVRFPGFLFGPVVVDEPPPVGSNKGFSPVQALALAVGHCMSSTFLNTMDRSHVPTHPIRTTVRAEVGLNAKGRRRVRRLDLNIETSPIDAADQERFDRGISIFEDYCTVSGAVREGVQISVAVRPRTEGSFPAGAV